MVQSLCAGSLSLRGEGPLFRTCYQVVCSHSWTQAQPGAQLRQRRGVLSLSEKEMSSNPRVPSFFLSPIFSLFFFVSYKLLFELPPALLVQHLQSTMFLRDSFVFWRNTNCCICFHDSILTGLLSLNQILAENSNVHILVSKNQMAMWQWGRPSSSLPKCITDISLMESLTSRFQELCTDSKIK